MFILIVLCWPRDIRTGNIELLPVFVGFFYKAFQFPEKVLVRNPCCKYNIYDRQSKHIFLSTKVESGTRSGSGNNIKDPDLNLGRTGSVLIRIHITDNKSGKNFFGNILVSAGK